MRLFVVRKCAEDPDTHFGYERVFVESISNAGMQDSIVTVSFRESRGGGAEAL